MSTRRDKSRCSLCGAPRIPLNRAKTEFGVCTFIECKNPTYDLDREGKMVKGECDRQDKPHIGLHPESDLCWNWREQPALGEPSRHNHGVCNDANCEVCRDPRVAQPEGGEKPQHDANQQCDPPNYKPNFAFNIMGSRSESHSSKDKLPPSLEMAIKLPSSSEPASPPAPAAPDSEKLKHYGLKWTCATCGEEYAVGVKCDLCKPSAPAGGAGAEQEAFKWLAEQSGSKSVADIPRLLVDYAAVKVRQARDADVKEIAFKLSHAINKRGWCTWDEIHDAFAPKVAQLRQERDARCEKLAEARVFERREREARERAEGALRDCLPTLEAHFAHAYVDSPGYKLLERVRALAALKSSQEEGKL